jgi:transcriptional regulator with XRE-family HTH domain
MTKKDEWKSWWERNSRLIREVRKQNGTSLRELSKQTGVTFTTISRFENGKDISAMAYVKLMIWVTFNRRNIT